MPDICQDTVIDMTMPPECEDCAVFEERLSDVEDQLDIVSYNQNNDETDISTILNTLLPAKQDVLYPGDNVQINNVGGNLFISVPLTITRKTATITIAANSSSASKDLGVAPSNLFRFSCGARITSGAVAIMSNIQGNRYLRVATSSNRTSNTDCTFDYIEVTLG